MNWCDLVIIGIFLLFAIIGLVNGFIFSLFRICAFFISIIVSVELYPVVARLLLGTPLFTTIKTAIFNSLMAKTPGVDAQVKQAAADRVVEAMHVPGFLKSNLLAAFPDPSKLVDISRIVDGISGQMAKVVVDVISVIVIYIGVRVALIFVRAILKGVAKLPVIRQMDKLGGFAFGAVEGLLTVYILFAVLMLFQASPGFSKVFADLDASVFAKYFYQHNFVIDWIFRKGEASQAVAGIMSIFL